MYASIVILSSMVLFASTYLTLFGHLRNEDHRNLQIRLLSYWAQYRTGGIDQLRNAIEIDNLLVGERPFFIRLSDRANRTVFLSIPSRWQTFPFDHFEREPVATQKMISAQSQRYPYTLEVGAIELDDGLFLQIGASNESRESVIRFFERSFLVVTVALLIVGIPVGMFLSSRALRPVHKLNQAIQNVLSTGDLDARLPVGRPKNDLEQLMTHFNQMLAKIQGLVDGMRGTLDTVAHDLRTPLTRLRAGAESALQGPQDSKRLREALSDCLEESDTIIRMIAVIMDLTEAETGILRLSKTTVDLRQVAAEVVEIYSYVAEEADVGLTLSRDASQPCLISADVVRIRQLLANLVDNAVKYSRPGDAVTVGIQPSTQSPASIVEIVVRDSGIGIDPTDQPLIFDRLYRGATSRPIPGLGLGLALVKAVVAAHGGTIAVDSAPGRGTTFTVSIPSA